MTPCWWPCHPADTAGAEGSAPKRGAGVGSWCCNWGSGTVEVPLQRPPALGAFPGGADPKGLAARLHAVPKCSEQVLAPGGDGHDQGDTRVWQDTEGTEPRSGSTAFSISILSSRLPAGCVQRRRDSWDPSSAPYFHVQGWKQSDLWDSALTAALNGEHGLPRSALGPNSCPFCHENS